MANNVLLIALAIANAELGLGILSQKKRALIFFLRPAQTTDKPGKETWINFEEGLVNFVASNVPKIAFDVIASKHAHFCDGLMDVRMLRF